MIFKKSRKRTTLPELRRLVEKIDKFEFRNHYSEVSRCGSDASSEILEGKINDKKWIHISWQWRGPLESGEGMQEKYLQYVDGACNKLWSGYFNRYNFDFNSEIVKKAEDIENGKIMQEMASIAKEKYLNQKSEERFEGNIPLWVVAKRLAINKNGVTYGNRKSRHFFSVEETSLEDKVRSILCKRNLPFDVLDSKVYSVIAKRKEKLRDEEVELEDNVGNLLLGKNWALFGYAFYGEGKTENCEYAYRKNNRIRFESLKEKCKITDDRKVKVKRKENHDEIILPEKYNVNNILDLKIRKRELEDTYYFGTVLAGGRLDNDLLIWRLGLNF